MRFIWNSFRKAVAGLVATLTGLLLMWIAIWIVIGSGGRRRIGETWLELRLLPLGGYVATYPEPSVRKFPLALFYCGGVLANFLTLVIFGLLGSTGALPAWLSAWEDLIAPMLLMQALCIINLLPISAAATVAGVRIGSCARSDSRRRHFRLANPPTPSAGPPLPPTAWPPPRRTTLAWRGPQPT